MRTRRGVGYTHLGWRGSPGGDYNLDGTIGGLTKGEDSR
jgi:hypothetical protein